MSLTGRIIVSTIPGFNGYKLEKELNHGHFGRVFQALHIETNTRWACKLIEKKKLQPRQINNVKQEAEIMSRLNHPNIIKMREFVETSEYYILVMELMRGGDLFDRLEKQTTFLEEDARSLIYQVARAVQYLHQNGIAHRDLKIENLMFESPDKDVLKVGDFGLAKQIGTQATKTPCGTKEYMAPEVVRGDFYSQSVDIWSLGCLAFILLYGTFPFYNENDSKGNRLIDVTEKIKRGYFTFPNEGEYENEPISESAKDLIKRSLVVDVTKRLTIDEFMDHDWLRIPARLTARTNAPAALRTAEGVVSMREYLSVGMHVARNPELMGIQVINNEGNPQDPDPQQYIANQISQPRVILAPVSQSQIMKARTKKKKNSNCMEA